MATLPAIDTSTMSEQEIRALATKLLKEADALSTKEFDSTINFLNDKLRKMGKTKQDAVLALCKLMKPTELVDTVEAITGVRHLQGYGPGSPMERLVQQGGKVLLLGAPLDSITVLHYAEAIADIPGKRRVSYEQPVLDEHGSKVWRRAEEFDSNGIIDCFAEEGAMDAVETIARAYAAEGRHRTGRVGHAECLLVDAQDIVRYGKAWLEARFG